VYFSGKFFLPVFVCFSCVFVGVLFFAANHQWVDFGVLERYAHGKPSIVLDHSGKEWFRFQSDRREPVALSMVPSHVIDAFLASEDWQFFHHPGVSLRGIFRSVVTNFWHGRRVQGASTITQQLVKLLFLDSQKTFARKLKEQVYSLFVERQFTKDQILEIYLNNIYLGSGIYGVQAASQRFWSKDVGQLSIDEGATLAAIIRSPAHYCPLRCPDAAQRRRDLILNVMYRRGFITQQECDAAFDKPVVVDQAAGACGLHVRETIRQELERMFGRDQLYGGGLVIRTTINPAMQDAAEEAFCQQCASMREKLASDIDGGLLSIDVATGEIRAVVGGYDFGVSKFNRALQARRQVGSVFKPLVYAAAVESGFKFSDTVIDEPVELLLGSSWWRPKNWDSQFSGEITLARALSQSSNIVTIKTLLMVGVERVIAMAKACRMRGPFHPYPSLALGCVEGSLAEVVGMFNVFANDGVYVEPHFLLWVKDQWGAKKWRCTVERQRAIPSRVSGQVAKVLGIGFQRLRRRYVNCGLETEVISKTGTTNDWRTCWFVGATPAVTTAVYMGRDDNKPMGAHVYPIRTTFPIWLEYHRRVPCHVASFSYDPSLISTTINGRTGKATSLSDVDAITVLV